jgi:hypothetical protein
MVPSVKSLSRHVWFFVAGSLVALGLSQLSFGWVGCYSYTDDCTNWDGCKPADSEIRYKYITYPANVEHGYQLGGSECGTKSGGGAGTTVPCGRFYRGSQC